MGGRGTSSGGGGGRGLGAKETRVGEEHMAPWMKSRTEDEWEAGVRDAANDSNRVAREIDDLTSKTRRLDYDIDRAKETRDRYNDMARQVGRTTDDGKAYMAKAAKSNAEVTTLSRETSSLKTRIADLSIARKNYDDRYERVVNDVFNYYKATGGRKR